MFCAIIIDNVFLRRCCYVPWFERQLTETPHSRHATVYFPDARHSFKTDFLLTCSNPIRTGTRDTWDIFSDTPSPGQIRWSQIMYSDSDGLVSERNDPNTHSPDWSFDSRWNSNLSLLHWIVNSTQNYNFESKWHFNSIQNFSFELNCQSNAANLSWNSILNQMIGRESE